MLQLENRTPFKASITVLPDATGVDTLYATLRGTFSIVGARLEIAAAQPPVRAADDYTTATSATSATPRPGPAGPTAPRALERASLRHAGEIHLAKPSTDVLLSGHAVAPRGRAPQVDVALSVGPVRKTIRVFGDREWKGLLDASISAPVPFDRVPLIYERAFGGVLFLDPDTGKITLEPRNPAGVGFARRGKNGEISARLLPNLEDPRQLITSPNDQPPPAGFGPIAPSWEPRRSFVGTYDEAWRTRRAPYLPADFSPRFFNTAPPDLVCKGYLRGGEPVEVLNASPTPLKFRLPLCHFDAQVHLAGRIERPELHLETVSIEPDELRVTLLWRAAVPCDKRALRVERVRLEARQIDLGGRPS